MGVMPPIIEPIPTANAAGDKINDSAYDVHDNIQRGLETLYCQL